MNTPEFMKEAVAVFGHLSPGMKEVEAVGLHPEPLIPLDQALPHTLM